MNDPVVFWTAALGILFLAAGAVTYRRDIGESERGVVSRVTALGPVLVASALAAFAGEHFTAANSLAKIVPKFMPAPLFIAYAVGVAHLAAASSFVARRYVRWSSLGLAIMFALFVLLMDLPGALARPGTRILWSLVLRQATFAVGALALYATVTLRDGTRPSSVVATIARLWTACALVCYGIENVLYPQFIPGVPDVTPTPSWIPVAHGLAFVTGAALIVFGLLMFGKRLAAPAAVGVGVLMMVLTIGLFVPQFFLVHTAPEHVNALNFVFDTLLFGGTVLTIGTLARAADTSGPADAIALRPPVTRRSAPAVSARP